MRPGLITGVNVDPVDVAAGLTKAVELGYTDKQDRMVIEYALMRHRRGEEEGARSTWVSYYPRDLTSWSAILAAAITAGTSKANAQEG